VLSIALLCGAAYFIDSRFVYLFEGFILSAAIVKLIIFWQNRGKGDRSYRGRDMSEIYRLVGYLMAEVKPIEVNPHHKFITDYAVCMNGILALDYDGQILYANDTFCSYLDVEKEWLLKQNFKDLVDAENYEKSMAFWNSNKTDSKMHDFTNYWTVNQTQIRMHWALFYNDNEKQVAYCVLNVRENGDTK
jgi:PAS domain-containing protein